MLTKVTVGEIIFIGIFKIDQGLQNRISFLTSPHGPLCLSPIMPTSTIHHTYMPIGYLVYLSSCRYISHHAIRSFLQLLNPVFKIWVLITWQGLDWDLFQIVGLHCPQKDLKGPLPKFLRRQRNIILPVLLPVRLIWHAKQSLKGMS